jgi:hypothetical protein
MGPPHPLPCIALDPAYDIDFGDLRVGQSADRSVVVDNTCTTDVSFAPSSFREAVTPFAVVSDLTTLAAGGTATITVRATPTVAGATEGTLFVTTSAPAIDRRAVTLFVRSTN